MKNKALLTILVGSIAQLVHGATIDSNSPVTGSWSDFNSWLGGTVPDTYGFDSVIIHAGDVIDYDSGASTPGGLVGPGGLAVAGGQSITLDGGTLTQATIANEIRIGEGSSGTGDGILTIDNGGSFNSGAAVAVAVGASLGGGPGSGVVNLNNGTFTMGAGAGGGGLVVGLDGSTGVFNVGDGLNVATLDLATNNIGLGIGYLFAGPTGGTGTVAVNANGAINFGTVGIAVGTGGGTATLSVNGGTVTGLGAGGGGIIVGDGTGTTGTLDLGSNGVLTNSGELRIGSGGGAGTFNMTSGTLTISNELNIGRGTGAGPSDGQAFISGGVVTANQTVVGRDGAHGVLSVSGVGTAISVNGTLTVGDANSVGEATINAGTVSSSAETRIGEGAGGVGTLNVSGTASWSSGGEFQVGNDGGTGTLTMTGGDIFLQSYAAIGRTGGTGTVHLSGGTITKVNNNGSFDIGSWNGGSPVGPVSTGTLEQTGGAIVDTTSDFNVGRDANTVGTWNMSGGTANFAAGDPHTVGQNVRVGNAGTGTANFTGGTVTGIKNLEAGSNAGAIGVINVNYPNGSDTLAFDQMYLGYGTGAVGTVNVSKGTLKLNDWSEIGRNGGTASVNIVGPDSHFIGSGADMQIGYGNGAIGSVNITEGGTFTHNWWVNLGRNGNATGSILVDGPGSTFTQTNGRLNIGGDPNDGNGIGNGFVQISNGGHYEHAGDEMNYGTHPGSNGTMSIISGGTFNSTGGQTHIGNAGGTGTLNVTGAGSSFTVNDETFVGIGGGSIGTMNLDAGGTITINQWLNVGRDGGTGTLNQTGGTMFVQQEARIGWGTNGTGTFNISSGTFTTGSTTDIGDGTGSVGTLNLSGDAVMTSNGEFWTGNGNGTGITNIDGGSIIANSWFDLGRNSGTGTVNLNSGSITKLTTTGQMNIGSSGTGHGTLNQTGGTITNTIVDTLIARDPQTVGEWNFTGGTATLANFLVGATGHGTLNITGTDPVSLTANQILVGGQNGSTGVGTINISNPNAVITSTNEGGIGRNGGHGEVHQSAGTVSFGGGWFGIANDPQDGSQPVSGLYDISGGQLNVLATNIELGADGVGELRITGTAQVTANNIHVAQRSHGTGTLTIADTATLTASGQIVVGYGSANANVANVSGGIISSGTETVVGQGINGGIPNIGTFNLNGPASWTSGGEFQVGNDGGIGVANISDGVLTALSYVAIGRNTNNNGGANGGNGTVNMTGGSIVKVNPNSGSFDVGSWNGGNGATTNTTGTLNQSGGNIVVANSDVEIGRDSGVVGVYTMTGGTLSVTNGSLRVGDGGNGTYNISAGAVSATVNEFRVANNPGATGLMNIGGTDAFTLTAGGNSAVGQNSGLGTLNLTNPNANLTFNAEFWVGNGNGNGTMNMDAGSIVANSWFDLGRDSGTGVVNLTGGSITKLTNTGQLNIGSSGTGHGTLNQMGGTITNTSADTLIARDSATVGVWNMQGGTATLARLNVGNDGNGTLNMSGGNISASDRVSIAPNGDATGTVNLNGGVLTTQFVEAGGGVATLNMDGGTLQAFGNEGDFLRNINSANSEILAGGITFDSNNFAIVVNTDLDGVGGLTKIGNGAVALTNSGNAYGGSTTVTGGTLLLANSEVIPDTSAVVVNGVGATFNVNGNTETVASIASVAGSTIALGNGNLTAGANDSSTVLDGATTGAGGTLNKVGLGTLTINGPQSYSVLNSNSGITTLNSSLPNATLNNNGGILNVNANATNSTVNVHAITNFGSSQTLTALNIDNASVATLTAHSGGPANVKAIDTSALTFAGTGKLDLTNNAMVVRGGNYATLYGQVVSGLNMGAWNGVGINSSTAATDPTGRTALAIVDNSVAGFTDFAGVTGLTGNEVILKYTYYGDADLSGTVTQDDYFLFLEGFVNGAPASWLYGDFDYSGSVTQDDYFLFLETYLNQGGALRDPALTEQLNTFALQLNGGGDGTTSTTSAIAEVGSTLDGGSLGSDSGAGSGASAAGRAVVPEPSSIALLAVGALGLITRRRRAAK